MKFHPVSPRVLPHALPWLLAGLIWSMPLAAQAEDTGRDAAQEEERPARGESGQEPGRPANGEAGQAAGQTRFVELYKQNFLVTAFDFIDHRDGRKQEELKFQISIKKRPLDSMPFFLAYTQKSFWQIFQDESSRPFRENNFNPEGFFDFQWRPGGILLGLQTGLEHESNGRGFEFDRNGNQVNRSRSWNRVYLQPKLRMGRDFLATLKYWERLPEGKPSTLQNPDGDDNPDIEKFLGHFELRLVFQLPERHEFLGLIRKGRKDPSGTFQLDYVYNPSFFIKGMYFHFHFFNGFGESLIDYDRRVKKAGFGFAMGNPFETLVRRGAD